MRIIFDLVFAFKGSDIFSLLRRSGWHTTIRRLLRPGHHHRTRGNFMKLKNLDIRGKHDWFILDIIPVNSDICSTLFDCLVRIATAMSTHVPCAIVACSTTSDILCRLCGPIKYGNVVRCMYAFLRARLNYLRVLSMLPIPMISDSQKNLLVCNDIFSIHLSIFQPCDVRQL